MCLESNLPSEYKGETIQKAVLEFESFHTKWKSVDEGQKPAICEKFVNTNPLTQKLIGASFKNMDDILKRLSSLESIDQVRKAACEPMIKEKENAQLFFQKGELGLNALDAQLDKPSPQPAIIHVRSNEFYDEQSKNDEHGMVVVGRKMNAAKNRCEYFLRDSRAGRCDMYKKGIDCDSKNGGIWVSQQQLQKMMIEVSYLDP